MTILALDTTSEYGSVALRRDGQTLAELRIHSQEGFSPLIFPALERLLDEARVDLSEIDCFAAANGPGSFTGVRVGLSTVKGLAESTGRKVAGISNLRAVSVYGTKPRRAVVLDARRGEVYAAVYNDALEAETGEAVLKFSDWLSGIPPGDYELITNAERSHGLAAAVALCAERTQWWDPAALDANYVRRSDAELFWKESS
ncbi:MAG TPA: tRNA (adenosine(37)-N6)-threonylcarbamoyltransferase complex dimerization subunit type 1 TsaB [Bryobacteraceae bacterium]|nr:tRNA (adenosine(37)-N6)-threonylcarbamoyltransferase complex dimerization subunit type 1 TsaB [Bryobacteraceae bacterium]